MLAEKVETLSPEGYASKGGKTVTVKTFEGLKNAVQSTDPMIVIVECTIKTGDKLLSTRSNRTLMGKDKN